MTSVTLKFREVSANEIDDSLCNELKEFLSIHSDEFSSVFVSDLSHIDQRACNYNGIDILSVDHDDENKFSFEYSYDFNIYNGCADQDIDGKEYETASFSLSYEGIITIDVPDISNLRSNRIYD